MLCERVEQLFTCLHNSKCSSKRRSMTDSRSQESNEHTSKTHLQKREGSNSTSTTIKRVFFYMHVGSTLAGIGFWVSAFWHQFPLAPAHRLLSPGPGPDLLSLGRTRGLGPDPSRTTWTALLVPWIPSAPFFRAADTSPASALVLWLRPCCTAWAAALPGPWSVGNDVWFELSQDWEVPGAFDWLPSSEVLVEVPVARALDHSRKSRVAWLARASFATCMSGKYQLPFQNNVGVLRMQT